MNCFSSNRGSSIPLPSPQDRRYTCINFIDFKTSFTRAKYGQVTLDGNPALRKPHWSISSFCVLSLLLLLLLFIIIIISIIVIWTTCILHRTMSPYPYSIIICSVCLRGICVKTTESDRYISCLTENHFSYKNAVQTQRGRQRQVRCSLDSKRIEKNYRITKNSSLTLVKFYWTIIGHCENVFTIASHDHDMSPFWKQNSFSFDVLFLLLSTYATTQFFPREAGREINVAKWSPCFSRG